MTSYSNAKQEEPTKRVPTTDIRFDTERDGWSDVTEEEMKKFLSTAYERGSKKPMKKPLTASWGLLVSDADMEKIKTGFKSRSMDDKWDFLIEDPDVTGNISLHIIRSWLREEFYILHIAPKPSNDDDGSAKIQSITWEGNHPGLQCDAEQAKKKAVILSRCHLHCEFETLSH